MFNAYFILRCLSKVGVDIRETHPGFTLDNFRKELADSLVGGFLQVEKKYQTSSNLILISK